MRLAAIIPVHNRAATIEESLRALALFRRRGHRVIVADGGSSDESVRKACRLADRVVAAPKGWSRQINAGCRAPEIEDVDALVFLPEQVRLPADADRMIARGLSNACSPWGRFDVRLECGQARTAARLAQFMGDIGARLTGIGTPEQVLFVTRGAFLALEGFTGDNDHAVADFCQRAQQLGPPVLVQARTRLRIAVRTPGPLLLAAVRRETARFANAMGYDATIPGL